MEDAEKELDLRMARVFVPDSTSQVGRERLRELLQQMEMQVGVQEHNSYVKDFVQVRHCLALHITRFCDCIAVH
eukprot:5011957-Prymnesium_polylepis.1